MHKREKNLLVRHSFLYTISLRRFLNFLNEIVDCRGLRSLDQLPKENCR